MVMLTLGATGSVVVMLGSGTWDSSLYGPSMYDHAKLDLSLMVYVGDFKMSGTAGNSKEGWVSTGYMRKQPACRLIWSAELALPKRFEIFWRWP